jgi:hypothetical protein
VHLIGCYPGYSCYCDYWAFVNWSISQVIRNTLDIRGTRTLNTCYCRYTGYCSTAPLLCGHQSTTMASSQLALPLPLSGSGLTATGGFSSFTFFAGRSSFAMAALSALRLARSFARCTDTSSADLQCQVRVSNAV